MCPGACVLPAHRALFPQLRQAFPTRLPSWKGRPRALRSSQSQALPSPAGSGPPSAPLQVLSEEEQLIQHAGEAPRGLGGVGRGPRGGAGRRRLWVALPRVGLKSFLKKAARAVAVAET